MKLIYVASPYAGDIEQNTAFARKACRHVMNEGHAFFAPHLLYPNLLDDSQPQERQLGINMGLAMLEQENGFVIGNARTVKMAEAPQQAMAVGTV